MASRDMADVAADVAAVAAARRGWRAGGPIRPMNSILIPKCSIFLPGSSLIVTCGRKVLQFRSHLPVQLQDHTSPATVSSPVNTYSCSAAPSRMMVCFARVSLSLRSIVTTHGGPSPTRFCSKAEITSSDVSSLRRCVGRAAHGRRLFVSRVPRGPTSIPEAECAYRQAYQEHSLRYRHKAAQHLQYLGLAEQLLHFRPSPLRSPDFSHRLIPRTGLFSLKETLHMTLNQ